MKNINDIKIVDYNDNYAASLAEMWNRSSSNWGGYDSRYTADDIIEEHKNSDHINNFLAVNEDEVIGYCSFSEYKEDEGALYIPLLNVRPDYHGKKVGKKLVLTAVKRAVELNWPRLDLYTWPGNTKAVPLYKKCGFFWEKRDDKTHLMNFIPTILNTEAVNSYFKIFDWYQDSRRKIEIKPDGNKENNYGYYEYIWQKNNNKLRIGFDRRGRGIRLIETDDYLIRSFLPQNKKQELIFGREYNICYQIINKTGKQLDISLKGINNKNINFSLRKNIKVREEENITGKFYLNPVSEEQNKWRTHPSVVADLKINGKKALFKMGIASLAPVKLNLVIPDREIITGVETNCYLDIENNFEKEVDVQFRLPSATAVQFNKNNYKLSLNSRERSSVKIPCQINKNDFYSENIKVNVEWNKEEITFQKDITTIFRGRDSKFGGETEKKWFICNNKYLVTLNKNNNQINIKDYNAKWNKPMFLHPRLGLPFTPEFAKKRPEQVNVKIEENSILMEAVYQPDNYENLKMTSLIRLYSDGLVENSYKIVNDSDLSTEKDIWLGQGIHTNIYNSVIPYCYQIIEVYGSDTVELENWEGGKITENWIFNRVKDSTRGICWPKESQLKIDHWYLSVENNLGIIPARGSIQSRPVYMFLDTYQDYHQFRRFALNKNNLKEESNIITRDKIDVSINDKNPFIQGDIDIKMERYKRADLTGKVKIISKYDQFDPVLKRLNKKECKNKDVHINIANNKSKSKKNMMDLLQMKIDLDSFVFNREKAIFKVRNRDIILNKFLLPKKNDIEIYSVNNGPLTLQAATNFAPTLFSMKYQGKEWLDSSFPETKPRSWWNPWFGGIVFHPDGLKNISIKEADYSIEFVNIQDNKTNSWQGICIKNAYEQNEQYKGLVIKQYFLTLPGIPVLLNTNEIIQNTGYFFNNKKFISDIFLSPAEKIKDCWLEVEKDNGEVIRYRAGRTGYEIRAEKPLIYGGMDRRERLLIYQGGNKSQWGITNLEVIGDFIN